MNAPISSHVSDLLAEALSNISLDDKYTLERGRVYLTGTQALVRLAILQQTRDQQAGLNTAGFISGYRGSPLGALDQTLWSAQKHLKSHHIVFQAGLNEELAATAVWGSQQVNLFPDAKYDGVFGMWYGKGPGVDRCGDVLKHANAAGTSPRGGVLVLAGDDHAAKSSTLPHQSDHIFKAALIPVLYPATVQEYLDLGLHGIAMSRYAGVWVGMKCVADIVEGSSSVYVDPDRVTIQYPTDFQMPADGLNIRWPDAPLDQEARILNKKLYAALAYCRANRLNHTVIDSSRARLGIVASGKAYVDTMQALADLGLDAERCEQIGIRLYKVGMVWPLDAQGIREFATGLEEILVIEEKRQVLEYQIKEELYNWNEAVRPRVYGKFDERPVSDGHPGGEWTIPQGTWLLPAHYELNPSLIAGAIASRLDRFGLSPQIMDTIQARLALIRARELTCVRPHAPVERKPYFCSGCPHNTSTVVPQGSRATAGIGCHYMAVWMDRNTETFTQMGGEGVPWIGQSAFTHTPHIFANLGDGTYFHSGSLAIRASVAAKVNITYKLLYNDAVAMTGGQHIDGSLTIPQLIAQVKAEGVVQVVVVTDEPDKYGQSLGVEIYHRDELDAVQRQLREVKGTTILIYDQTCASEKRRRRKRKDSAGNPLYPDPAKRVVINDRVCEGCGDCSQVSNCLSVEPLPTAFGVKRTINQSSCNKDFSCVKGFCPSFVTVEGGQLKKPVPVSRSVGSPQSGEAWATVPDITPPPLTDHHARYGILVTGVGGTGVVTIGAWLGMAAHLERRGISVLDMAGLAQKGGAVFSHVQLSANPDQLFTTRIATGEADVMIGGDLIVSASTDALSRLKPNARAVVNLDVSATADFIHNPGWTAQPEALRSDIMLALGDEGDSLHCLNAQAAMTHLMGDAIYANPFLLGFAWQKGWIPLSRRALLKAIELNGVQVEKNQAAFEWGRLAAHDPAAFKRESEPTVVVPFPELPGSKLSSQIERFTAELVAYQDQALADRYLSMMHAVREKEGEAGTGIRLQTAVANTYFRLLAIKDEYEVARLLSRPEFLQGIGDQFEGDYRLVFHLAPPTLGAHGPSLNERPPKRAFGPWMLPVLRWLARGKRLRGTVLDVFGKTAERTMERALITQFETLMERYLPTLSAQNVDSICTLVRCFDEVRGYGPVKLANHRKVQDKIKAYVVELDAKVTQRNAQIQRPVAH